MKKYIKRFSKKDIPWPFLYVTEAWKAFVTWKLFARF